MPKNTGHPSSPEARPTRNPLEEQRPSSLTARLQHRWRQLCAWLWDNDSPPASLPARAVYNLLRIVFITVREARRDRITLRASALTFTVVLSMVPVLALGTAVLKGLGAGDQMRQAAYRFIDQLEEPAAPELVKQGAEENPIQEGEERLETGRETDGAGLTMHLRRAVDQIFDYVDRTDFATLGTFGILGLVLAAISVLGSIEQSMNTIWQVDVGRPVGRKIIDYLALMILLPLTVNLALATEATLQSPALLERLQLLIPDLRLVKLLLKFLPVLALILTFTLLYRFIPNAPVALPPAMAGGIFGGLSWLAVQMLYVKLQIGVARYNAIYGSFATLPLFLLWVYIAWVVFLAGAEAAFAFQVRRRYHWVEPILTPVIKLGLAFEIMETALNDYRRRRLTRRSELAERLHRPEPAVAMVVHDLLSGDMLRRVADAADAYVPVAPEEEIKAEEFLDLFFGTTVPDRTGCSLAGEALAAARQALAGRSIHCNIAAASGPSGHGTEDAGTPR